MDQGGFLNPKSVDWFGEYARFCSADFLGLNYYFGCKIRNRLPEECTPDKPIDILEGGYKASYDPSWKQINPPKGWIYTYPEGLRRQLHQFRTEYGNPRVIITENGCMDTLNEGLNDISRIEYLRVHLAAVAQAIQEGCNVIGYTAWSLMDNFEWSEGYEIKFGLYRVDFNDPDRKRTPKASALWYKKVVAEQAVDLNEKLINSKI
uniref:Beta-glucosidase n=1 Tax=Acrobeloides nanus TaxID=290746 RepID=A0A914DJ72_9BILA